MTHHFTASVVRNSGAAYLAPMGLGVSQGNSQFKAQLSRILIPAHSRDWTRLLAGYCTKSFFSSLHALGRCLPSVLCHMDLCSENLTVTPYFRNKRDSKRESASEKEVSLLQHNHKGDIPSPLLNSAH